jgi:hypothetical protein
MKNAARLLVVLSAVCLSLGSCGRGRQAEKLDRDTALALLRESGEAVVPGPASWELDLLVYDTGPAEEARLAFLKSLTPGVVKLTSTTESEPPGFSGLPSWMEKRKPVKRYEFEPTDPKGASTMMRGETMKPVYFKIATPQYREVTGIIQEGTQAVAMVVVSYRPNDLYRTVGAAIAKAGPQPGFPLARLAPEEDLGREVSRQAAFRKYDDGWRVEARSFF